MGKSIHSTDRDRIKSSICRFLLKQEDIEFAILFGSFKHKKQFRDIDIGIYLTKDLSLLKIGYLKSELDLLTGKDTDLLVLNNLYDKNPELAYEIVAYGEVLFTRKPDMFKNYKKRAFLIYFDTAILRNKVNSAFKKRLLEKKFGQRDYA